MWSLLTYSWGHDCIVNNGDMLCKRSVEFVHLPKHLYSLTNSNLHPLASQSLQIWIFSVNMSLTTEDNWNWIMQYSTSDDSFIQCNIFRNGKIIFFLLLFLLLLHLLPSLRLPPLFFAFFFLSHLSLFLSLSISYFYFLVLNWGFSWLKFLGNRGDYSRIIDIQCHVSYNEM